MEKTVVYFLLAGIFLYSGIHAQYIPPVNQDSLKNISDSIKTVTITATRTSKDVMDAGRDVTIISSEQIKDGSYSTLAELLSQQAGVFITGTGQVPGAVQSLLLRGADENHTTVMIDGVPVMDPSSADGAVDISELSLADVDKIEIVRGSHSTLYGSSSIGGVINIITNKNNAPGFHADINVTGGEFGANTNLFEEKVSLNYTAKCGFYAEAGYDRIDDKGISAAVDTLKHPLAYQQNPQNNIDKGDFYSKLGFKKDKWSTFVEYRNMNKTFGIAEGAFSPANNYIGTLNRNFFLGNVSYAISPLSHIQYVGSYSNLHRKYLQDTSASSDTSRFFQSQYYTSVALTNEIQASYDFKSSHFILGTGMNYEKMTTNTDFWNSTFYPTSQYEYTYNDTSNSVSPHQTIYNVFAQADLNGGTFASVLKPISILIGGRFSSNSMFGNNLSYEINPYVKIDKNSIVYLSYSTGFNAPALYQLYGPNDMPGDAISLANSALKPETSTSYEIGIKHHFSNVYFTLSWYNTVVSNYIDYVYIWNKNKAVDSLNYSDFLGDTYLNVGQETTKGLEMNIAVQVNPKLTVTANISVLSSSISYSNSSIDTTHTHGNQVQLFEGGDFLSQNNGNVQNTGLLRRPGTMANVTITYKPIAKLTISGQIRYVGSRTDAQYAPTLGPFGADAYTNLPDYTMLDIYAKYQVTKKLSSTLIVNNVFNTTYYEILGYTTLG
ncbi:MAG TPA: TonB-dependent receptor, partial [Bacteroidia bacterium]|nr:TonB-dependent receptor [Bacteroidia bacterium]